MTTTIPLARRPGEPIMSGGSYDYLYQAQHIEDLLDPHKNHVNNLRLMVNSLTQRGMLDAAAEAEYILAEISAAGLRVNVRMQRLHGLFKAVEWNESGDSGPEVVQAALESYRRHGNLP